MTGPRRRIVDVDVSDMKRLADDMLIYARKAIPHAARNALNETAFEARHEYAGATREQLTLRNRWTERSIAVDKARGTRLEGMESRTGSLAEYMQEQEEGFTASAKGKHGVPIQTSFAAGQGMRAQPRTRAVQQPNRMPNIQLQHQTLRSTAHGRTGARRQRNAVAIRLATKTGSKYVFLDLGKRKGIFKLTGSRKLFDVHSRSSSGVKMVWDLSKPTATTRAHPMLANAVQRIHPRLESIWAAAIVDQLRRHRILHYSRHAQFGY